MSKYFSRAVIKKSIFIAITAVFVLTGVGCKGGDPEAQKKAVPITLSYWTVASDEAALRQVIDAYRRQHPNVTVNITTFAEDRYEFALLEAWAEDRGPDIFSIRNKWVGKYLSKIDPQPATTNLPFQQVVGSIKKEVEWVLRPKQLYGTASYENIFMPQIARDAVVNGQIWGVPLSFDTLALYYNRDLFNNANIVTPPQTWVEFVDTVKRLTILRPDDSIAQSAAGIGRADNVANAVDVVSLLMQQNGAVMTNASGRAIFDQETVLPGGERGFPAIQAVQFYTDYANPNKEVYTWNDSFVSARDAFAAGTTAMYFGYAVDRDFFAASASSLRFSVAPVPQIDPQFASVNMASYWLETVSKKSSQQEWAWDLLYYITSPEVVTTYLSASSRPTAVRAQKDTQIAQVPALEVFNNQALTATSWYKGTQPIVAYELFADMIGQVNASGAPVQRSLLRDVAGKINQTY